MAPRAQHVEPAVVWEQRWTGVLLKIYKEFKEKEKKKKSKKAKAERKVRKKQFESKSEDYKSRKEGNS